MPVLLFPDFYPPALTSGNAVPVRSGHDSHISIHPLLRAGTRQQGTRRKSRDFYPPALTSGNEVPIVPDEVCNFYPPALTSGNHFPLYFTWYHHFYPPALTSGNGRPCARIPSTTFLSTRSYEREPFPLTLMAVAADFYPPALTSGNPSCLMITIISYFYPPALTSGNKLCSFRKEEQVFLSTRSYERELPGRRTDAGGRFLSTRSYERERFRCIGRPCILISIHPLLRAGTSTQLEQLVLAYFYPPALTSGN